MNQKRTVTNWVIAEKLKNVTSGIKIFGKPEIVSSEFGDAVAFNGSSDGLLIPENPVSGLNQFTIEILFCPGSGGSFEQRFLHCGESAGDRVLLELRSTEKEWYLDAFIKTGENQCVLIDKTLLHPLDRWIHVAFVVDNGILSTWVNKVRELEGSVIPVSLNGTFTSVGVRQNEISWFKGIIYSIRFTDAPLEPENFI